MQNPADQPRQSKNRQIIMFVPVVQILQIKMQILLLLVQNYGQRNKFFKNNININQ
jgi:hypothetical protein